MSQVPRLTILGYHKLGEPPPDWRSWYYVPESTFVDQLTTLGALGWSVIDVNAFLDGLKSPEALPEQAALLTFDDGFRSLRDIGLPILRRLGLPAVCFVPTDYVGASNTYDEGGEPEEPICDWNDLRTLSRGGVSIQSHGVSHVYFSLLEEHEQENEIRVSKEIIENALGTPVHLFAYPYSDYGKQPEVTERLLDEAGYCAAFLCGGGPATLTPPFTELFRSSRLAMGPDTDLKLSLG